MASRDIANKSVTKSIFLKDSCRGQLESVEDNTLFTFSKSNSLFVNTCQMKKQSIFLKMEIMILLSDLIDTLKEFHHNIT